MSKIRFFTKTAEDGRRFWRIEGGEDVTPDELESAVGDLVQWLDGAADERDRFFYHVTERREFDQVVNKLHRRGWSERRIARKANAELLALLGCYLVEFPKAPPGSYEKEEAIPLIVAQWGAVKWLRRADALLAAARPGWSEMKRQEEIVFALEAMQAGTADPECLIDRNTVRRKLRKRARIGKS